MLEGVRGSEDFIGAYMMGSNNGDEVAVGGGNEDDEDHHQDAHTTKS